MSSLFSSLRARLVVLVVAAWLPVFTLVAYLGAENHQDLRAEIRNRAARLADRASLREQASIETAQQTLHVLSQIPSIREANTTECGSALTSLTT